MQPAPIPKNEKERLLSLYKLGLLDTKPEKRFDCIARLATKIFDVPISTLTLVDEKREWFKSVCGLDQKEGDRAISFCGHALLADDLFIIPDTRKDERFADNPMVLGKPYIRFYAGVPIMSIDGERVGVFCIKDTKPRGFSKDDGEILKSLAAWAEMEINSLNLDSVLRERLRMRTELKIQMRELKNANTATQNILQDYQAEKEKIAESKVKIEAILKNIGEGVLAIDAERKVMFINKVGEDLLGWKEKDLIGKVINSLPLEDKEGRPIPLAERPTYQAINEEKNVINNNYFFVRKDKTKFAISINVTPIRLNEKMIGAITIFRDITKEREIDKAKTEFVSLASHQLRTPLTAINWYVEMLQSGDAGELNPGQKKYLGEIYKGSKRMVELVDDLLNISRIETGRLKINPEMIDLTLFINDTIHEIEPWSAELRHQIIFKKPEVSLPMVAADKILIRQVIHNIITNAVRYSPGNSSVSVAMEKRADEYIISVSDEGIGIPPEVQSRIFEKFFRADNARLVESEGSGIGLYISRMIMEVSGGKLWFESPTLFKEIGGKKTGYGTTFHFSIPISDMKKHKGEKELAR